MPDTRLQLAEDVPGIRLHAEFAGVSMWLALPSTPTLAKTLPRVPPGINAICVGTAIMPVPEGWQSVMADVGWRALFSADVLWEVDANLRLHDPHALPAREDLHVHAAATHVDAAQTAAIAPVLLIPGVFETGLCTDALRHFAGDCGGGEPSGVVVLEHGRQHLEIDPTIKQRRESLVRDPGLEARMHERLMRRALPEIARVFNFQVSRRDPFKLLGYEAGAGYFRPHRDNETSDVAYRRFALSINLNAGDYAGGEFRFPEFGLHRYAPETGCALVFSCSLLHEVLPVERRTRYAMTTFLA